MSDLDLSPRIEVCRSADHGVDELLLTARRVYLGKTTEVARVLPDREIRMIGAWCFLDHYGPEDVSGSPGMQVYAHPHTGLQTVSWLLEGEVEHRDSVGSQVMVRPGELHWMTAGRGIVHSELSQPDKPPRLHGLQLWVALPDATRDTEPRFDSYRELPWIDRDGVRGQVLIGELDGVVSPAQGHTPLLAADLVLQPGSSIRFPLDPADEHGVFVVEGDVSVGAVAAGVDQLVYLPCGRDAVALSSESGGRVLLLGGAPFGRDIVLWWNFVGRSHDEIVANRAAWVERTAQFPPVVDRSERVMEAPALPTVQLKPRPPRVVRPSR